MNLKNCILYVLIFCTVTLVYVPSHAHECVMSGNNAEEIMKYNQCIANQSSNPELEKIKNEYELEIQKLLQDNIRLERRIAKIKTALATIISSY